MSSVSAACIFDAYSASSAHTDTFYIVSQIVRVRNSKRHFFSKLTFPYIIQPLCFTLRSHRPQPPRFHPTATSTTAAPLHPTATSTITALLHLMATLTITALLHPTATLTTAAPLHPTATSTTACHFAQRSRLNSSAENFSYFFKNPLTNTRKPCIMFTVIWVWRRLVARYLGVVEAAGSNPVTQTS